MTNVTILINTIDKVKHFVQAVAGFDGELEISTESSTIDAKSIMGIFSLDITSPLTLSIHNDEKAPALIEQLQSFIV